MVNFKVSPRTLAFDLREIVDDGHRIDNEERWKEVPKNVISPEILKKDPDFDIGFLVEIIKRLSKVEELSNIRAAYDESRKKIISADINSKYHGIFRLRDTYGSPVYIKADYKTPQDQDSTDLIRDFRVLTGIPFMGVAVHETKGKSCTLDFSYGCYFFNDAGHYLGWSSRDYRMQLELKIVN